MLQIRLFILFILVSGGIAAQNPYSHYSEAVAARYSAKHPVIHYELEVDTVASVVTVDMHLRNVAKNFQLGMFAHPEYDDKYWRNVRELQVTNQKNAVIVRKDSALWNVTSQGGDVTLSYRVLVPRQEGQRGGWRPFISSTGALIGGAHFYMYVVGAELAPSHVQLKLPAEWKISTGLQQTSDPHTFFASTVSELVDAPVLTGRLNKSTFHVDGVPHTISYWPSPSATPFDEKTFVSDIHKIAEQAITLFGRAPYKEYHFLIQDNAYGGLEHANSVTLGIPSSDLAGNVRRYHPEIVHEYFHTWNLVRIRPVEYGDVTYIKPKLSRGLWWSEGLTMFYADVLLRRAGLRDPAVSRIAHLQEMLSYYYGNPGNYKLSPEKVSLAEYGPEGMLGDYTGNSHLQGELIGTLLDIIIRNATDNRRSMDDVMKKMMEQFSGRRGFTSTDIERIISETCRYSVKRFFDDHVRGNKALPFNTYLQLAGLTSEVEWKDAVDNQGKPQTDRRAWASQHDPSGDVILTINDPGSAWGRAGLHTGDRIISINNTPVRSARDFFSAMRSVTIGDVLAVQVKRNTGIFNTKVVIAGYKEPKVKITELTNLTPKQQRLKSAWLGANKGEVALLDHLVPDDLH